MTLFSYFLYFFPGETLIWNEIKNVYYPGLGDENQNEIFKNEYKDSGSIISFELIGDKNDAYKFLDSLKVFSLAVSLGSVESLIQHPATMTHSDLSEDQKNIAGISDTLIRCSVGVEDIEDLILDILNALNKI